MPLSGKSTRDTLLHSGLDEAVRHDNAVGEHERHGEHLDVIVGKVVWARHDHW
jgi:hypothetical protein